MKYLALIFLFLIAFAKSRTVFKFRSNKYKNQEMEIQTSDIFLIKKNGEEDFKPFDIDVDGDKLGKNQCLAYEKDADKIYKMDLTHEACDEVEGYVGIGHYVFSFNLCCFKQFTYFLYKSDNESVKLAVKGN
jgi:hypothetical protein